MTIALSHGGPTTYRSPAPSSRVLVGTINGVVAMERDGRSDWRIAERTLADRHIHAVLVEPRSGAIFAGANFGSIHVSLDAGRTWERRDRGLVHQDVYSLACCVLDGRTRIYAGTEPAHLFVSDDLGLNWTELPALRSGDTATWNFPVKPNIAHTKHIEFHPGDPRTMYVCVEQGGLLRSTDGGRSFEVLTGMDPDLHRTVINPQNPDDVVVTTGVGLYASADGGRTWERRTDANHEVGPYPDLLVSHPRRPELMFLASAQKRPGFWYREHYANSRIFRSTDGGRGWQAVGGGFPGEPLRPAFEAILLEDWGVSFTLLVATATGEVWGSDDGGEHWREVLTGIGPVSKGPHHTAFAAAA